MNDGMLGFPGRADDVAEYVFDSVGTFEWTPPAGLDDRFTVLIDACAAGGGGCGNQSVGNGGGGGGGGGRVRRAFRGNEIAGSLTVVVPAGGAGGAWSGVSLPGAAGGDATVTGADLFVGASGGEGGTTSGGGAGGSPLVASGLPCSMPGFDGAAGAPEVGSVTASTFWGGAGGSGATGGTGGSSAFAGAGGAVLTAGDAPGGGGGAATNAYQSTGGDGGRGEVRIVVIRGWYPTIFTNTY